MKLSKNAATHEYLHIHIGRALIWISSIEKQIFNDERLQHRLETSRAIPG